MLRWSMRSRAMSRIFLRMSMLGVASARSMSISTSCITSRCRSLSSCAVPLASACSSAGYQAQRWTPSQLQGAAESSLKQAHGMRLRPAVHCLPPPVMHASSHGRACSLSRTMSLTLLSEWDTSSWQ